MLRSMVTVDPAGLSRRDLTTRADSDGTNVVSAEALPSWFVVALVGALTTIVGFGTIGLGLADIGVFLPVPTLALAGATTFALLWKVAPWRLPARRDRSTAVPAGLAVALAIVATAFAVQNRAEHVLVDRDPGAYMVTARWMATHHNLQFHEPLAALKGANGLWFFSPAVYDQGGGHLYFQFSHLFPTLLAEARWIGGDGLMFCTPPILGGLGLLCFYALATRFVRPWVALGAAAALAVGLGEMHFMRDAYSELPTQVLLLGGLWLLTRSGPPRPALAGFTGLVLGAVVMARVDGPLYLVAIPFAIGATVVSHRRRDPGSRDALVAAGWLVAGTVLTAALGYTDVALRSTKYVELLGNRAWLQYVGLAVMCLVVVGIAAWIHRLATWSTNAARGWLPDAAAIVVGAGLLAMWFVRPHIQQAVISYPHRTPELTEKLRFYGIVAAGVRTNSERSLIWHSWYLGPLTLAAGIAGVALLTREVLRGKSGPKGIVVATFLPVAAVYLWNPNILSDQIWVMRRYFPFILPCFVIFAFVVVDRLLDARGAASVQFVARGVAVALVGVAIAWPISTDWSVRDDRTQNGFLGPVQQLCHLLGPRAAVVILQGGHVDEVLPQTLRSYCDIPVAIGAAGSATVFPINNLFETFASESARTRRTLFVIAATSEQIDAMFPELGHVERVVALNTRFLEKTISNRPHRLGTEEYRFVVAKVPAAAGPLAAAARAARAAPPGATRVLLVGNSVAHELAPGFKALQTERSLAVLDESILGCGFPPELTDVNLTLRDGVTIPQPPCDPDWEDIVIDAFRPDIVFWIVSDPLGTGGTYRGQHVRPCTPPYDLLYQHRLQQEVATLSARGARVVIPTEAYSRYFGVKNYDHATDCQNASRRRVAAATGAQLADLFGLVCPHGDCRAKVNGVTLRPDGLNYQGAGAVFVAQWLMNQAG